ncbi:class II aldolase/adducin family protein [Archaeoglobus sp.]
MRREIDEMIKIGRKLGRLRLVDGASGNMSCRIEDFMLITRSGSILDELTPKDFVYVKIGEFYKGISSDWKVHKAVYEKTDYKAVLHCHGVYNVVLSLMQDEIVPKDLEGELFLKRVRVVDGEFGSEDVAEAIADEIARNGIAIHKGHGIYSAGRDILEAFNKACYLEHSCEILYRLLIKHRM